MITIATRNVIDVRTPSAARMQNYLLGGVDHYPPDRAACRQLEKLSPGIREVTRAGRAWLNRVVASLSTERDIVQYLDHGAGLPEPNPTRARRDVHRAAQLLRPEACVIYIDNAPMVIAHGRMMLDENDRTAVVTADMRDTDGILQCDDTRQLIQASQPVAALLASVLHCIPDGDAVQLVQNLTARLPRGSYLAISHLVCDDARLREEVNEVLARTGSQGGVRSTASVQHYFDDLDVVDTLGDVSQWRTAATARSDTAPMLLYGGLARIP